MDLRWLDDFLVLTETGNFTRAAELRNSSQPAFSRRIRSLEGALKVTLFDRSHYPTRLTPEGETFRAKAADILAQLQDAVADLAREPNAGVLNIALPFAQAHAHAANWLADWRHAGARFNLMPGALHDLMTHLVSGHADLVLSYYSPSQPILLDSHHFERITVGRERVTPFAQRGSGLDKLFPGTRQTPCPMLNYPASVYFGRLTQSIIERAPRPIFSVSAASCELSDVLRDLANHGMGVAWLPQSTVDPAQYPDLVAIDPTGAWSLDIEVVAIRNRSSTDPALQAIWSDLEANGLSGLI